MGCRWDVVGVTLHEAGWSRRFDSTKSSACFFFLSGCSEGPAKSRWVIFRRGLRRLRGAYGWASWSISSTSRDRLWQGMLQLMAPLIAKIEYPSLGYPWIWVSTADHWACVGWVRSNYLCFSQQSIQWSMFTPLVELISPEVSSKGAVRVSIDSYFPTLPLAEKRRRPYACSGWRRGLRQHFQHTEAAAKFRRYTVQDRCAFSMCVSYSPLMGWPNHD